MPFQHDRPAILSARSAAIILLLGGPPILWLGMINVYVLQDNELGLNRFHP